MMIDASQNHLPKVKENPQKKKKGFLKNKKYYLIQQGSFNLSWTGWFPRSNSDFLIRVCDQQVEPDW